MRGSTRNRLSMNGNKGQRHRMHHECIMNSCDYDTEEIDTRGYRASRETRKGSGQQTQRSGAVSLCSFCQIADFERGCREVCPSLFRKAVWRLSRSGDVRGEEREQRWHIPMARAQTRLTLPRCRVSVQRDLDAAFSE